MKRFTDTEKWNKKFIRSLKPPYKLLWLFILDECNVAGIWDVDFEVAQLKIGMKITEKEALSSFKDKVTQIDGGNKWFVPAFIEFQYGTLSDGNRAHAKTISLLKKFNLIDSDHRVIGRGFDPPTEAPLNTPTEGSKDIYMETEEDKEEEMVMEIKPPIRKLKFPFESQSFLQWWELWKTYKDEKHKFKYSDSVSEQAALNKLVKLSFGQEDLATQIIEESIANGWKGFFPLKPNSTTYGQSQQQSGKIYNATAKERLAQRMAELTHQGQQHPNGDSQQTHG